MIALNRYQFKILVYAFNPFTHCLYRFLDNQKNTRSQFSFPGLREIHRNLKQKKKFNSREGFFRKSPFCTFFCINPGFGGPWDKLWIFFLIAIFMLLHKNAFGQKKIWISCTGSKLPFWQFFQKKPSRELIFFFRFLWIPQGLER